jgi:hypothetical protein
MDKGKANSIEIQYVTLSGGESIPAYKMICPECNTLVLGSTVNTESIPWRGYCPDGHRWRINNEADA